MAKRLDYIPGCLYKIWQDSQEFSFTTDAVLLGNFPHIVNKAAVLDLGCGTGAVGMICRHRGAERVLGIDCNPAVTELLQQSLVENHLEESFTVVTGDIREHRQHYKNESFDLVVANPPYRIGGAVRTIGAAACHEGTATLEDFFRAAAYGVKYRGRFALVQLPDRFAQAMFLAHKYGLQPKRLQWVHSAIDKPAWIFLMEMQKGGAAGLEVLPPYIGRGVKYEENCN